MAAQLDRPGFAVPGRIGRPGPLHHEAGSFIRYEKIAHFIEGQSLHVAHDLDFRGLERRLIIAFENGPDSGPILLITFDLALGLEALLDGARCQRGESEPDDDDNGARGMKTGPDRVRKNG